MTTIRVETVIAAPAKRCFFLSLSIDLHIESTSRTGERAISDVTSGLIQIGQQVTWEARHFGVKQRFTSEITAYEPPAFFQDTMVSGAFASFQHDHRFVERDDRTLMIDELRFRAPLGVLGRIAEALLLRRYLTVFLAERNDGGRRLNSRSLQRAAAHREGESRPSAEQQADADDRAQRPHRTRWEVEKNQRSQDE